MLLKAEIVFLLLSLTPNNNFSAENEYVGFVRASDTGHNSEDCMVEITKDEKRSEDREIREGGGFFENFPTLEEVWSNLKLLVHSRGTNGYIHPNAKVVADFELIVLDMMKIGYRYDRTGGKEDENSHGNVDLHPSFYSRRRSCDRIDLRSLEGMYRIGAFVDRENGRSYCILATKSILHPWGNVIVDLDSSSVTKNLSFDCPHPKYDAETGEQGIRMLKGTTARSWIVSGSHRMANNRTIGTCQPQYSHYPSDVAHSVDNCFLAAVAAIKFYYESVVDQDYTSVQLHGMGKSTCTSIDTFFSHGSCSETVIYENHNRPNLESNERKSSLEKIDILQTIAQAHPLDDGRHAVAGKDGGVDDCKLCGSTNVQGRLINGVTREDLCDTFASSYNGRFVHIEQKREYRRESHDRFWNDVFNDAYPLFLTLDTMPNAQAYNAKHDEDSNICLEDKESCVMDQELRPA